MSKIYWMYNSSSYKNDILGFMQSDHGFRVSYTQQSTSLHFLPYLQCGQTCANKTPHSPSEDTDQLRHPPNGTRAFAVHVKKLNSWVSNERISMTLIIYCRRYAHADLSHRYMQIKQCPFCVVVTS